jgi:rhamnulokinase
MTNNNFLAFDLGASSGRAMLGSLTDGKIILTEIHRFPNQMIKVNGHYYWNIFNIFKELKTGLKKCIKDHNIQPLSIGVDTWGVDIALLDREGMITGLPNAYRDSRTDTAMEDFYKIIPRDELYRMTGIQFMQFNTLFQLFSMVRDKSPQMEIVEDILFTPDALNYLFCGIKKNEYSIASTSQLLKPGKPEFEKKLFDAMNLNVNLMQDIVLPGEVLGNISAEISKETGSDEIPVVAVASHDTASAVASVPAKGKNWAYISSGTWSLMGIETDKPLISDEIQKLNYTNEGGVEGTTRFLKNIMGLWLLQECRRHWLTEREYSWPEMVEMSIKAEPFKCLVDPDDISFLNPENMPEAIISFCKKTGQPVPGSHGQMIRCIFESLALKYRFVLDQIRNVSPNDIENIHIIGGGANNELLCQFTSNSTGMQVLAGPTEATAIGNIMMQAKALGVVESLEKMREMIKDSIEIKTYSPQETATWNEQYIRFKKLITS